VGVWVFIRTLYGDKSWSLSVVTSVCVCMYVCMYVYMCVCVYVCMCMCVTHPRRLLTDSQMENSPSRRDGITRDKENEYRLHTCAFIQKAGQELRL